MKSHSNTHKEINAIMMVISASQVHDVSNLQCV